jgi:RimJ/RimL family protein N-acetyltransferase
MSANRSTRLSIIGDELVRLRPLDLVDVDEWMAGEDDEQIRWFEFPGSATRQNVIDAIQKWMYSWRTSGPVRHWAVREPTTDRILGGVEVRDLGGGEVNLSYVVFPWARRRGIATRAAELALAYAVKEMGARTAIIKVLQGNEASLGVAFRLGAVESGTEPSGGGGVFIVLRRDLVAGAPGAEGDTRGSTQREPPRT